MKQMKTEKQDKAKLLRKLHGYAKEIYELTDPHPILHQLAVAEYDVESMSDLSCKQLQELIKKVVKSSVNWDKVEALGVTRVPQMSISQKITVKRLQKELGWSDEYMDLLTIQRYGYLDWQYLHGKSAWLFVRYLIGRSKSKKKNIKSEKVKEVM